MRIDEKIRLLVFALVLVSIYAGAALMVCLWVMEKSKRFKQILREDAHAREAWPHVIRFRRIILTTAGIGIMCAAYAFFIEPNWLDITHVQLSSHKLPPDAK